MLGSAAALAIHPVPDPYRWDESFTVELPQMDDEHRGLFNAVLKIEGDNNMATLKEASIKFHDHFLLEESLFKQTMTAAYIDDHLLKHNSFLARFDKWEAPVPASEVTWSKNWLVQHIKNTDFQYVGAMPHPVPKPYHWDDSVETFYKRIDDEHKSLFDLIRAIGDDPMSIEGLNNLKTVMRAHFDYESGLYCNAEAYNDCVQHNEKHNTFFKQLLTVQVPVSQKDFQWAANWLVQHIRNTDFGYKSKLDNFIHEVPRPYVWNPMFEVFYDQLDAEHKGLFDAIRHVVEKPDDAGLYDTLKKLLKDHFVYEQSEFQRIPNFEEWALDHIAKHDALLEQLDSHSAPVDCDFANFVEKWFVQHVMNTDMGYRGKLVHEIPAPYVWDESFTTFYKRMDDEHKVLFDCVRECSEDPSNAEKYAFCKTKLRRHFDYEESEFCRVEDYDCHGHYLKHYRFQTKFQAAHLPLTKEVTDFAKNWLVQHIKNTDFAYGGKLYLRRHYLIPDPYLWDSSFAVGYQQMDEEHVGLFDTVRNVEANRNSQEAWNTAKTLFNEHFAAEEELFTVVRDNKHDIADHRLRHLGLMNTVKGAQVPISEEITEFIKNWLAQHIKNTDFSYRGLLPEVHPIPTPFKWNSFFAVFYKDMDEDHKELFSCLAAVEASPTDEALLRSCLQTYKDHFTAEEELMAKSSTYPKEELHQHINKHNLLLLTAESLTVPVSQEWIDFAKNWLTQHIPNTDFRYKEKLPFPVSDPIAWDESFQVYQTQIDDEHVVLFNMLQQLKDNPDDLDILNSARDVFRDHFDYEEKQFMWLGKACDASGHKKKHDIFFKTLTWVTNPVSTEYLNWAANWLVQHIKNTDFLYRYKLKTNHNVPDPYVWNSGFEVHYPRLDQEHVNLFKAMYDVEKDLTNQPKVDHLKEVVRDHFFYEEAEFCDATNVPWDYCTRHKTKHSLFSEKLALMNAPVNLEDIKWAEDWLVQHIKNSDFGYKGALKHEVPEPYVWDESFKVDYSRLDEEHSVLFANILAVSQHPEDVNNLKMLKENIEKHFEFEEQRFCAVPHYNCVDHKQKHYKFWLVLEDLNVPVNCEHINWAKNWLAQHIKNTDRQYKTRLQDADTGENFSGSLP